MKECRTSLLVTSSSRLRFVLLFLNCWQWVDIGLRAKVVRKTGSNAQRHFDHLADVDTCLGEIQALFSNRLVIMVTGTGGHFKAF